jgi:hypothetical protein
MEEHMNKLALGICLIGSLLVSCASQSVRTIPSLPQDIVPRPTESEVVIQYNSSILKKAKGMLNIFVDGEMVAQVEADTSERIIVPNGSHSLSVREAGKKDITFSAKFEANSQRIVYSTLRIFGTISLSKESETALSIQTAGIGGAVNSAGNNLKNKLPQGAAIAVLGISTANQNNATYVINELEYILVDSGQFRIVDRKSLDMIRSEQDFQTSGEISDESAVSIGQMLGASIVITGSINETGSSGSLILKALDVKTAQIVTMEREFY